MAGDVFPRYKCFECCRYHKHDENEVHATVEFLRGSVGGNTEIGNAHLHKDGGGPFILTTYAVNVYSLSELRFTRDKIPPAEEVVEQIEALEGGKATGQAAVAGGNGGVGKGSGEAGGARGGRGRRPHGRGGARELVGRQGGGPVSGGRGWGAG